MKKLLFIFLLIPSLVFGQAKKATSTVEVSRGQSALTTEANTTLSVIGTYYKIAGVFTDGNGKDFTVTTSNRATYNGSETKAFLFNGASDLLVDKACTLTYGLYKNGTLVGGAETPHDFTSAAKTENIAITAIITLSKGDYLEIRAKSTAVTTVLTVKTLITTYWGAK